MNKIKMFLAGMALFAIVGAVVPNHAKAYVDYREILTIGTSTTVTTGSSTILTQAIYTDRTRYRYFRADIQYIGVSDMRYTNYSAGTPTATAGIAVPTYGIVTIDNIYDMQNFKACCGTTTVDSYGTATAIYRLSHEPITQPLLQYKP